MHEFRGKPSAPSHCFRFFFVCFFHPFPSGGASAGHCFWSDTVVLRRNWHNQRQSKSYQLSQGPQAPAEVTLSWLTSRIPAVNQRRVTDSGCSAPSHRLSWGCGGIIAKMKTVMVYRLPTLRPFTGVHDGNDKRTVRDGSLSERFWSNSLPFTIGILNDCDSDVHCAALFWLTPVSDMH